MAGVQQGIDAYNAAVAGDPASKQVPSAAQLFRQWSLAVYLDDEHTSLYDIKALDLGGVDSQGWTIDLANDEFYKNRGTYNGSTPEGRFAHSPHVPPQSALPFGTSYETFRNPGKTFRLDFTGPASTRVISEPGEFWYGGNDSQSDKVLSVTSPAVAGQTVSFDSWYFVEDGWDFGFVEAQVGDEWVTLPVKDAAGAVVSTNDDPHGNNTEGNGLTGTSGGQYFVDQPALQRLSVAVPAGATGLRFRYSTDAAYVDTGWFVRNVSVGSAPASLASDDWSYVDPEQTNNWSVQIVSPCDLTPGATSAGESVDETGRHVYAFSGATITQQFTQCSTQESFTAVISNLTSGAVDVLDAPYKFRITNTAAKAQK
jgi:hypothetical protein